MPRDSKSEQRFTCPITKGIMVYPVMAGGRSYEESALLQWLQNHSTAPLTNEPLHESNLQPN